MRSRLLYKSIIFLIIFFLMVFDVACAETISFKLIKIISLPTVDKSGDAVSYDPYDHAVYVSMGKTDAGAVVIDAKNNQAIKIIHDGLMRPYGMSFNKRYVYWTVNYLEDKNNSVKDVIQSNESRIFVVDKTNWKVVNVFKTIGSGADGIWVDQKLDRLYIAMDDNNWIDEYTLGRHPIFRGKISLYPETGSGPDLGVLLASSHVLYMPDDTWEEKINLLTNKIEQKTNLAPYFVQSTLGKKPATKGQIYDSENQTLWVGTTGSRIFIFNARNLKILASLPARAGIDQVAYDPKFHLVYAFESKAKGFDVYDARTMKALSFVSTGYAKTHTGAVDPSNHRIFVYVGAAHAVYVYQPIFH